MAAVSYRQCVLYREPGTWQTTWLPERYAHRGTRLRLRREDKTWQDGWVVTRVGESRVPEENLPDPHAGVKGHRKQTGDSLPRNA
jgi:hypothetical protein